MRKRWWVITALGFVVTMTAAVVAGLAFATPPAEPTAGEVVAAYDAPRGPDDPAYPRDLDLGIVPSTARFAGEEDGRRFWLGRDADSRPCLVVVIGDSELAGAACANPGILRERGMTISVSGPGASVLAVLVSDDVDLDAVPAPWTVLGDNLLVADPSAVGGGTGLTLPRDTGPDITVPF